MPFPISVKVICPADHELWSTLTLSVNMRATLTWIPRSLVETLKLPPLGPRDFVMVSGALVRRDTAFALVQVEGRVVATTVVAAERGDEVGMGLVALASLGLGFDESKSCLVPQDLLAQQAPATAVQAR